MVAMVESSSLLNLHGIGRYGLMAHVRSKYIITILALVSTCYITSSHADTADAIMKVSDAEILKTAKMMAEGVSRNSPTQIDSVTIALGAVFVQDTRTFIYKYSSSVSLDSYLMKKMIPADTCGNRIRKNLMKRGITFEHIYKTPFGEQSQAVRINDCPY